MKRIVLLGLIILLAPVILMATGKADTTPTTTVSTTAGTWFKDPVTLSFVMNSNIIYPTDPNLYIFKVVEEATNVKLDLNIIPDSNYNDKINLIVAGGDLPDLMAVSYAFSNKYGPSGAYVEIEKYISDAPTFAAFSKMPNNKVMIDNERSAEGGKLYGFPSMNYEGTNRVTWFYREDLFKANNLSAPKTYNEVYKAAKALKQKYPDSGPLILWSLFSNEAWGWYQFFASQWSTGFPYFFDQNAKTWRLGLADASFKALVEWFKMMYAEGLINTDFPTMTSQQAEEFMAASKAFMLINYSEDMQVVNTALAGKEKNTTAAMRFMVPPAGSMNGVPVITCNNGDFVQWSISSKSKKIREAVKYCDWFYTDKAMELCSWGKEGETFKVVNGVKEIIKPAGRENEIARTIYGFMTRGTFLRFDFEAKLAGQSPIFVAAMKEGAKHEALPNPKPILTTDELKFKDSEGLVVFTKASEEVTKFIVGKRDMGEWDKFLAEMRALGADKVVEIYNAAYKRTNK
jgi:putative aldouronate transport system substrate-binding protein